MFFLDSDDNGDWYLVPEVNRAEWEAFLTMCANWREDLYPDIPAFAEPIGGHPSRVMFEKPQMK